MSSHEELRKQVESLRQVNTSLQQEILHNSAHLSRLHENTTQLARLTSGSTSQSSSQSNSNTSSPRVSRHQAASHHTGRGQSGSSDSSPRINRQPHPAHTSTPRCLDSTRNHIGHSQPSPALQQRLFQQNSVFASWQNQESAISHLSKLQDVPDNHQPRQAHVTSSSTQGDLSISADLSQVQGEEFSFTDDMDGEHMATMEDGPEHLDSPGVVDTDAPGIQGDGPEEGDRQEVHKESESDILQRVQQLENERTNLIQQIESEEKNRKWYYDEIDKISRRIRSLPVTDGQQGPARKHLELEIQRLHDTMLESFGSNEQISQRRDARMHRIHRLVMEMQSLQQHRQQILQEENPSHLEGEGRLRHHSSTDSAHSSPSEGEELDTITMATQTEDAEHGDSAFTYGQNIPGAIYHGAWQLEEGIPRSQSGGHHGDLASVMSFNSTNTSSSRGSGVKGQTQSRSQQNHQQVGPISLQIPPQQLGTKVEMVYGLLSMLGTHDKDDMSKTLLAMSSSQDSCIAMRQSGCLPLLIQLLHGSDQDSGLLGNTRGSKAARARAAAALHNIVHSHPDDKRGRREARVLRLLEQIRGHCDQLRDTSSDEEEEEGRQLVPPPDPMDHHPGPAIATLMKLSFDEEHRHAICTLGGLHAIAELMQVDNDVNADTSEQYNITMRRYACMALTNLTFGDGTNKALLCSMKTSMEALVAQLFSSNEELCQVAASVLRNLSWKADLASKKTLREVGAVTSLMRASMKVQKETTLKSILSALWNLSAHCSENKADICAVEGALEFLICSLTYKSPSKTSAIMENGGGILRNVSSHLAVREDYRKILRQHGCLQILLKHLRATSLTIVSNACGTLWNLSARCAEDQQALWEMGAIGMLRNLVHSKHKMISMGSSAALKNLLAARPAMKNIELKKNSNQNRPTLHVRKQRALESEIDQNLSETCENMESPRDSPVEGKKQESDHFVYPVYQLQDGDPRRPMVRAPVMPRSQSGDTSLYTDKGQQHGVARSGSQDSVGSTHSDISHDRARHPSGPRTHSLMGGSLDRYKEGSILNHRGSIEGRTERNPLGSPNSRILQVMQEVALHAGINGQHNENDTSVFKVPYPVTSLRQQQQQQHHMPSSSAASSQHISSSQQNPVYLTQMMSQAQSMAYQRYIMTTVPAHSTSINYTMATNQRLQPDDDDSDEKPLDYSMKYQESGSSIPHQKQQQQQQQQKHHAGPRFPLNPPKPQPSSYMGNVQANMRGPFPGSGPRPYLPRPGMNQQINKRYHYNAAYAETDLDDPEQPTDYGARYGVEYNQDERVNYSSGYQESDPNCADCKLEEARRYNDRLDQAIDEDQIKTFCTEGTPYLSTATSLTDLSTAVKILEEAEQQCPADERDYSGDETHNFSSKYGENDPGQRQQSCEHDDGQKGGRHDGEKSSRTGSNMTDIQTGTTVITNYHIKADRQSQESQTHQSEEMQERSFHDNRNDHAPPDQMKTYCEEGTPVCFSRVSSLSSLHSSEAADRQEKRPAGPLQRIEETEDMNGSVLKRPSQSRSPQGYRQKDTRSMMDNSSEKEHKTVTFDDKEQIQETPMMFSRSTSLGSLSSFDTQSVHSSVFSEYSRRASEVVSPSELPDSPSETMPPSPRRTKSPERHAGGVRNVKQELFPPQHFPPQQFTTSASHCAQLVNPTRQLMAMNQMMMKQIDYETGSCKSEAPVVYADEGTPPIFNDNLSELSCITGDNYNINERTLVGSQGHLTPGAKSQGSSGNRTVDITITSSQPSSLWKDENTNEEGCNEPKKVVTKNADNNFNQVELPNKTSVQENGVGFSSEPVDSKQEEGEKNLVTTCITEEKVVTVLKAEEKALSSNSDVSEGEDEILANFINSAMPISTKKAKKSSDSSSRRKSSSSKPDSGSSSRSKTPAKSQPQSGSSSKSSSVNSSAKKPTKTSSKSSKENSPDCKQSVKDEKSQGSSPGKHKSQIPRPLQHRQIQQLGMLDTSHDSTRTYQDEESPFNVSNTQSVINRSAQKSKPAVKPSPLILQKARNLSNIDYDDEGEGCKTYATEDTPFSGSIPTSPKMGRKYPDHVMYADQNQDCLKTFATEDTPFNGSIPGSPPAENERLHFANGDIDIESDTVKCYNTEDTPFSGSAVGSPKMGRKQVSVKESQEPSTIVAQNKVQNVQNFQQKPYVQGSQSHPVPQTNAPSRLPTKHPQFNPQILNNIGYLDDYDDDGDDAIKSYATEGTPQNFSTTGSFSDLSSLNANFEEKVKIDRSGQGAYHDSSQKRALATGKPAPPIIEQPIPIDDDKSDSSSLDDNEDLLSEMIQSAMPAPRPGSKSRRSMDRKAEGAEASEKDNMRLNRYKNSQSKEPFYPSHFQPQRTSSLAQDGEKSKKSHLQRVMSEPDNDQVKTFAEEGTPNMSNSTSFSDLTTDSFLSQNRNMQSKGKPIGPTVSSQNNSSLSTNYQQSMTYSAGNNSVFLQAEGGGDSMRVFKMEGTPQSFSCNDSLSSLGIMDDDSSSNIVAQQVKALANRLICNLDIKTDSQKSSVPVDAQSTLNQKAALDKERSGSQTSNLSNSSQYYPIELERQVIGQSSEDQSVHEDDHQDQASDIHVTVTDNRTNKSPKSKQMLNNKQASRDEKSGYKVEHTPICFSRNSSLSSLSVQSDDDDEDPDDLALLEDCISSALPPRTRPAKEGRISSLAGKPRTNQALSADELDQTGSHDSRMSAWRKEPHRSSDELFRKPVADSKGRPCRSRSQDNEKRNKDLSNQQLAEVFGRNTVHRGSFDSLAKTQSAFMQITNHQQQVISETKNFTQQMMQMTRSVEKGDNQSEKTDSPASDYNFFMSCSGNTEISVENISKQSFPSSMAPDTDDDILDDSVLDYRNDADGHHGNGDRTLTEKNRRSFNSSFTQARQQHHGMINGMQASITSEDERALAENVSIVMSEMDMQQMILSGVSTVDEDRFIENETLSLVSNDYMSDTASEASNTWSAASDQRSEGSNSQGCDGSQSSRRPRIIKPENKVEAERPVQGEEQKGVRGRRKPLYPGKPSTPPNQASKKADKAKTTGPAKLSPRMVTGAPSPTVTSGRTVTGASPNMTSVRTVTGAASPKVTSGRTVIGAASPNVTSGSNTSRESRKGHTLKTIPQACSTPVKSGSPAQYTSPYQTQPHKRSSSLDQRSQGRDPRGSRNTSANRSDSANRSSGSNRSASVNRVSSNMSQNLSNQSRNKASPVNRSNSQDNQAQPRALSKQGTFIKESTNKNAPVISPSDKSKNIDSTNGVKMRQKKPSESSQTNRNSSGSSNYSNNSNVSNSFSTSSSDSPPDSWAKTLHTYNFKADQDGKRKGSNVRRNLMNDAQHSKIPSPSRSMLNKSSSGQSLKKGSEKVVKSSSGSSLKVTGSNNSLKQIGSRPTTPVVMSNRKGSIDSIGNAKNEKKTVTSKITGLWKSENKKNKTKSEKKSVSKLPVAKTKGKNKKSEGKEEFKKNDSIHKNSNRNTYILPESTVDGISKSSTYDKLNAINDASQIPSHDGMRTSQTDVRKSGNMSCFNSADVSKAKPIFDDSSLNKTCRDISVFEIGVEYDLEEAWASNIEKSIESMSRSIEENKNKIDGSTFYDDFVDTSKMDLTNSPANRLSKSGSMSEIQLEFGRIHSGTWTKKKSQNEFAALPNADETSRTLPLVKRSESLNLTAHLGVSHIEYDDGQDVWIRRDDRFRASDMTMSKKKRGFKGSSGFLNAVSKMFSGGSKKVSDQQSKSFITISSKPKKEKEDSKINKSEYKLSKAEQKAEKKAEVKMNKSLQKTLKKSSKSSKSKKSGDLEDGRSSTSSMKKSAEDLIDIDRSDDDEVFSNATSHSSIPTPKTKSLGPKSSSNMPSNNSISADPCANDLSYSDLSESGSNDWSLSSSKSSPGQHLTKTEMLQARRQAQISSTHEKSDDGEENGGKRKCIITTV
ncbi:adenomatous polyposis coli homolog isoform X2 [Mya arenaria]|uniref:adenomatous polyposis coli homolog isoform X2 n=1 Tax=Mya arenaria TaxID=6604 RepID=UPI0022DFD4A3|nr:adenomatous polyposis coli homolog isoform X2 [Mya arenaria]